MEQAPGEGDPIFQRSQPTAEGGKSSVLVWQFFLLPLLIVVAALAVFLLFGAFAGSESSPQELLATVQSGGGNEREQAAHQLALAINEARDEVGRSGETPFFADPAFQRGLAAALDSAIDEREDTMVQFLAMSAGRAQVAGAVPLLEDVLYPENGEPFPPAVRLFAAQALFVFEGRIAADALLRAANDETDVEIRNLGLSGLVRLGLPKIREGVTEPPAVLGTLRRAITSENGGSRINAAAALAVRGIDEPPVLELLAKSLSREELAKLDVPVQFQSQALTNACRAVAILGAQSLRPAVERLTDSKVEGDDTVRDQARKALAQLDAEEDKDA